MESSTTAATTTTKDVSSLIKSEESSSSSSNIRKRQKISDDTQINIKDIESNTSNNNKYEEDEIPLKWRFYKETAEMLDILYSFSFWISGFIIVSVGIYMGIVFPRHSNWEKFKPEIVVLIALESVLLFFTILMCCVKKKPEGKVVIYSIVVFIGGLIGGFTLLLVFILLINEVPSI